MFAAVGEFPDCQIAPLISSFALGLAVQIPTFPELLTYKVLLTLSERLLAVLVPETCSLAVGVRFVPRPKFPVFPSRIMIWFGVFPVHQLNPPAGCVPAPWNHSPTLPFMPIAPRPVPGRL